MPVIDNIRYEYNKGLDNVNTNASSLLLDPEEVAEAINYYWSQNGLRPRFGGKNFKNKAQFNGRGVININIYARQNDNFFYFIIGTTGGFLYFIRLSTITGATTQTAITDLSAGVDYPTDVYYFDPKDVSGSLDRLMDFQYSIFRSPTQTQTTGSPDYWAETPALSATSGRISTEVFNDQLYIIDGTNKLYSFNGELTSGNKLTDSSSSIQAKSQVLSTTEFLGFSSLLSRLFIATNDSYIHGSLINQGANYGSIASEYVTIAVGRRNGTRLKDFTNVRSAAIITAQNPQTKEFSTELLSSDGTLASIRIDGVDSKSGIIGGSSVSIHQDLLALTNYGFVTLNAFGANQRFGLTEQKSISRDINDKIRESLEPDKVTATYYANDKNWYMCQLNDNLVAVLSLDHSNMSSSTVIEKQKFNWTTFIYPDGIKQIKSLFNYLFVVDLDNNIVMQDVPGIYTDSDTQYLKRIITRSFGANGPAVDSSDTELKNYEKTLKKVKINGIARNLTNQAITVSVLKNSGLEGSSVIESNVPFALTLATALDLYPAIDLSLANDLFSKQEVPVFYKTENLKVVTRTFQIQIDATTEIDLELLDVSVGYLIGKEARSDS